MTAILAAEVEVSPRLSRTRLELLPCERVAVIGPNGSGKTTLLRALAGIEPGAGQVTIAGEDLQRLPPARRRRRLSFLPAGREIGWPIPVRDVIALGLDSPDSARVDELLQALDLGSLSERPVNSLSTGERARALLGRALAPHPAVLLLDEPLSNLDPAWALRILDQLDAAAKEGATVLLALHDLSLLHRFDRVILMAEGQVRAEAAPAALLASDVFSTVFGIEPHGLGWRLRPWADPRSSQ